MIRPSGYSAIRVVAQKATDLADLRRKRLNKQKNDWGSAILLDLLLGAGPWIAGTCTVAVALWFVHEYVEGAPGTFTHFHAPGAIAAISTFSAFLLVSKIQANLKCNSAIIAEFGNLTGSLINLALWIKSQMVAGKRFAKPIELPDGSGGLYTTNKIGLTLASVAYIVKYTGRGIEIQPRGLPLGQDAELSATYTQYTRTMTGSNASMTPFAAITLMISEQIDALQRSEKDTEYSVLFAQLNAATAAEGSIGMMTGYNPPYVLDALLVVVFILYLVLTLVGDLIPNNGANAVWISAIVAFCTISFFQISDRYWNPFKLRSKRSGQDPAIAKMAVSTELAITAIFAQAALASDTEAVPGFKMRF